MQKLPDPIRDNVQSLDRIVTDIVGANLEKAGNPPTELIDQLRDLEIKARSADVDPQTVQVIASGRRLLGDRVDFSDIGRKPKKMIEL